MFDPNQIRVGGGVIRRSVNGNNMRMAEMGAFNAELLIFSKKRDSQSCLIILRVDYQLRACQIVHSVS